MVKMILLSLSLMTIATPIWANEPMTIPVFLKYGLMQQVMLQAMFKGPGHTAVYRMDKNNCNTVTFVNPHLSGINSLLQVRANLTVKFGTPPDERKCSSTQRWSGRAVVRGKPIVIGPNAQTIQFKVEEAEVFDANGKQLSSGLISIALEGQLHPLLDQFKVDLKPQLQQLKSVLPFMLPGYSNEQIDQLIASVHLGNVQVQAGGLNIPVQLAVDKQSMLKFLPGLR